MRRNLCQLSPLSALLSPPKVSEFLVEVASFPLACDSRDTANLRAVKATKPRYNKDLKTVWALRPRFCGRGIMTMPYCHKQSGAWIAVPCLLFAAFDVAIVWRTGQWAPMIATIVLVAVAVVFSSLTVEVSDHELRWYFGPGFWTYRLPLDEIQEVAVVRNHWWNGLGIRMGSGFRLYNVSGLDAVELRLKSNEIRRIGTDDPQGLAGALKSAARRP